MELAALNLVCTFVLLTPIIKITRITVKRCCGNKLEKRPTFKVPLQYFCNISATAEASVLKFGKQLKFDKAHHKSTSREKVHGVRGTRLGELPKFGIPFIFSATGENNDFNFGMQLGFAKPIIKHTQRNKWA